LICHLSVYISSLQDQFAVPRSPFSSPSISSSSWSSKGSHSGATFTILPLILSEDADTKYKAFYTFLDFLKKNSGKNSQKIPLRKVSYIII
jgi:hypothetical protein